MFIKKLYSPLKKGSLNYVVLLNHKEVVYCKYLISKVCNCNIFKLRYLKPIYIWTCGANYWAEYPGHRGSTLEERDLEDIGTLPDCQAQVMTNTLFIKVSNMRVIVHF